MTLCAPGLDEAEADAIAAVALNNMKTKAGMARNEVPTRLARQKN